MHQIKLPLRSVKMPLAIALVLSSSLAIIYVATDLFAPDPITTSSSLPNMFVESGDGSMSKLEFDRLRFQNPVTGQMPDQAGPGPGAFARNLRTQNTGETITQNKDWVSRGPKFIGGRATVIGIDVLNEDILLAASATSGMYKSTNGGESWYKTTSNSATHGVNTLAQNRAPGKENIWYYGSGDRTPSTINPYGTALPGFVTVLGNGIFKSTDGGESWSQLTSTQAEDPVSTDPFDYVWEIETFGDDGVIVATSRGVYRSVNGGQSWVQTLDFGVNSDETTADLARAADGGFFATAGGTLAANGIYHSDDGVVWQNITPAGWPPTSDRTTIGTAPSNASVAYFFTQVAFRQQELRRFDAGVGWTDLTSTLPFNAQITTFGGVLLVISVKPDAEDTIFLGAVNLFRSTDGGQSYELISQDGENFHADMLQLAYYPSNPARMIAGNDGGLFRTENNLEPAVDEAITWKSLNSGFVTTQFYTVSIDRETEGSVAIVAGMQDNGTVYTSSADTDVRWARVSGADGGTAKITNGGTPYYSSLGSQFGIFRHDIQGNSQTRTNVTPEGVLLGLWLNIYQLDEFDQRIMYLPSRTTLYRNSNLTEIPFVQGGSPTSLNWDSFQNITDHYIQSVGMSPAEPRRLYYAASFTGSSANERVFYLDNPHQGQPTPVDITGENFPLFPFSPFINCIAVDPRDSGKLIVVFSSAGVISMFATENSGGNWEPVSGNLEENPDGTGDGPSVRWLTTLYVNDQPVYLAGTNAGLFSTIELDGMNTVWIPEAEEVIGNQVIEMIDVRQSDGYVAVATYGNGIFTTNITGLPTDVEDAEVPSSSLIIAPAYPNPFRSTTRFEYSLPVAGAVSVRVYDILGREVETIFEGSQSAGKHAMQWDASDIASGVYLLRVRFGGETVTQQIVLEK